MAYPKNLRLFPPILTALILAAAPAVAESLRHHVQGLAAAQGFALDGSARLDGEVPDAAARLDPAVGLDRLLADYNFIVTRDAGGRISRLTIIGPRQAPPVALAAPTPSQPKPMPIMSDGAGHFVDAVLSGPNRQPVAVRVMVDTGASTLVLPGSLAAGMGFEPGDFREVRVQTANGVVAGHLGTLPRVRVGDSECEDVAVTFVDDALLGGKQLLGMSFLSRFRVTIDSRGGNLLLEPQSR